MASPKFVHNHPSRQYKTWFPPFFPPESGAPLSSKPSGLKTDLDIERSFHWPGSFANTSNVKNVWIWYKLHSTSLWTFRIVISILFSKPHPEMKFDLRTTSIQIKTSEREQVMFSAPSVAYPISLSFGKKERVKLGFVNILNIAKPVCRPEKGIVEKLILIIAVIWYYQGRKLI